MGMVTCKILGLRENTEFKAGFITTFLKMGAWQGKDDTEHSGVPTGVEPTRLQQVSPNQWLHRRSLVNHKVRYECGKGILGM